MAREMKDSGIDWIGNIPKNWHIESISSNFNERNIKVSSLDYKPLSVTKYGIVPQLDNAAKSKNHGNRKLVKRNDFVINSRSDRKMSSGLSKLEGSVSFINTVLYSKSIEPEFIKYLLKNVMFAEEFYKWGNGIVDDLWTTRWDKMKKISIPVPPKEEQIKITEILDSRIGDINLLLHLTKKSIDELKSYKQYLITETVTKGLNPNFPMKDSGVDWIGEIPKHWQISKVKYEFKVHSGSTPKTNKREFWNGNIRWITPADMDNYGPISGGRKTITKEGYNSCGTPLLPVNSIIISNRAPIGKVNYNTNELCINQGCKGMERDGFNKYFYYLMLNNSERLQVLGSGTTFLELSTSSLENLELLIPPENEQKQIADYLDKKTAQIDQLIEDKTKLIEELENYNQSLIYEYVTGKKEV